MRFLCTILLLTGAAAAQEFEVATIKPAPRPGPGMRAGVSGGPGTDDPGRMTWAFTSLRNLIARAYGMKFDQVTAPDWANAVMLDVTAKLPPGATDAQIPGMLRKLLETRFRMKAHLESKDLPVYALSIAKSGSKLKAAAPSTEVAPVPKMTLGDGISLGDDMFPIAAPGHAVSMGFNGNTRLVGRAVNTAMLASALTDGAGRPVIDKTGLTGIYDVKLTFIPEPRDNMAPPPPPPPGRPGGLPSTAGPDNQALSIFGALQAVLGLRLDPDRGPVSFVVVDSIDKAPSEN